eukprot:946971-Amphidinium_carterae.1
MPVGNENSALCGGLAGRPQLKESQRIWQHYPLQNSGFTDFAWTDVPVHAHTAVFHHWPCPLERAGKAAIARWSDFQS